MNKNYSPENTIIAFDFHDVLVNYDYKKIIKTFWSSNKKFKLFIILLNPIIWLDIIKLKHQKAVSEQYIVWLGKKYKNLEPYVSLGIEIANTQKTNPDMLNLLKNLKLLGYELQLFSNIGGIIIQDAIPKFPEIFNCFSKIIVPSQENKYIRKPFDNAFINYLQENKYNKINKKFIFIDDKSKNTKKATKYGILGIRFKNHDQLAQEFKNLGILK